MGGARGAADASRAEERPLEVRVLGRLEVRRHRRPIALPHGRVRTLLVLLAVSAGEYVSFETLGDALWGEGLPNSVPCSVRTLVTRLRAHIGDLVEKRPGGYVLGLDPSAVDALRFVRLLDEAMAFRNTSAERPLLIEAIGLWRGQPFDDVTSDRLVDEHAPGLSERYLAALERWADLDLAAGLHFELLAGLRAPTILYPLRESLWARLLVVLDRCGRRVEALASYEAIRSRIADELGVDPGPELQRINADLAAGRCPRPVERIFSPPVPRQLPAGINGFTGRDRTLSRLDDLLLDPDAKTRAVVAALHGPAGAGKTAVAVHWAHRARDLFPDGQLFLDLRGRGPGEPMTPAEAIGRLLSGLADRVPGTVDARRALLLRRLAERRTLLVLDDALDAAQVRPLLPAAGAVLITSRNRLRDLEAARIAVDAMPADESVALLASRLDRQGITCDEASLTRLAELCGHLPLALVVAAERAARETDGDLTLFLDELRHGWLG